MAVAFHNLELIQYSSQFLNDNVGTVPGRYPQFSSNTSSSSFEHNPSCFTESPVAIWDPYAAITSHSPSFFPVGTEEPQLVYPTEEDLLVTDEFLRAIQASNSVGSVPQPVMINSDSSTIFEHHDPHVTSHISNPEHRHHDDHYAPSLKGLLFAQSRADQVTDQVTPPATSMQAVESEGAGSPAAAVVVDLQSPPPSSSSSSQPQPQPQPLHRQGVGTSGDSTTTKSADDDIEAAEVSVDLIQNRRPFRCGQVGCNKTFKNPQTMKMHHKTHYTRADSVDSRSPIASTITLSTLTSSLKAGNNKKIPSRCPTCRKTFVGLYELRRHYGRKHSEGEKPFGCRKCGKKFYIEVDVRDHEKLCGEPIECRCGLKFAFRCNLVAHKRTHPGCQEYASNQQQWSTSDEDSGQSRGSSPPLTLSSSRRAKRLRQAYDDAHKYFDASYSALPNPVTSDVSQQQQHLPGVAVTNHTNIIPPAPEFQGVRPDEYRAKQYDFDGLHYSTGGGSVWSSNMHYPGSLQNIADSSTTSTSLYNNFSSLPLQNILPKVIPQQQLSAPTFTFSDPFDADCTNSTGHVQTNSNPFSAMMQELPVEEPTHRRSCWTTSCGVP